MLRDNIVTGFALAVSVGVILFNLALGGLVVWVICHFVAKFW